LLSRQAMPALSGTSSAPGNGLERGAYVVAEAEGGLPDVVLIGTGSEVAVALAARDQLAARGIKARVVSMPSWELFDEQDAAYRDSVLPPAVSARVSVEAGVTLGWEHYVGLGGRMVGIDRFGESGKGPAVMAHLGITAENVVHQALALLRT
jgi:transketolase